MNTQFYSFNFKILAYINLFIIKEKYKNYNNINYKVGFNMRRIPFATFYMNSKPLEIMLTTIDKETDNIILTF